MSENIAPPLDMQEQIARIQRAQEETRKFAAEQHKLAAEQNKLYAEADKFRRERFHAPILAAGMLGGAIAVAVPALTRAWCG